LLLTLSPFHLYFSQEGRLYTLDVALLLAALIVFHLMLKGQKKRWVVLNGLLIALLGYSHYTALVVVGGQVAWLLVMYLTNWQSWKRAWMSWALAFLAMLVILPSAYQGLRLVYGSYQSTLQVWSTLQTVAAGFGKYGAFPKYDGELVRQIAPLTLLSLVVLGLLAWKSAREIWAVMVGVMGLQFGWTFVVLPLIGGLSNPSFNERHFLWNVPMVLSVAALGVECAFRHPSRLIRLVAGLLVGTTVILYSAGDVGYFVAYTKGSRVAVDFVSRQADQQDLILFNTRSASATWSLYGKPQLAVWDKPKPVDGQWQFSPQVSFAFGQVIEWTHTWREAITYPRVWVFYLIGQGPPELMSSLRIVYPREHVWTFGNLEVFLFER
jgi:hypothetical protein